MRVFLGKTLGATRFLLTPGLVKGGAGSSDPDGLQSTNIWDRTAQRQTDGHRSDSAALRAPSDLCCAALSIEDGSPAASPHGIV